jgi:hydrogenase maturation protease
MSNRSTRLLVLGLGNVLLSDDGVGPAALALLRRHHRPPVGTLVLDGGTLGLALLPYIEDAESVLLVDAVMADAPVGTLVRLDGNDVGPAVATRLSPHQVGVADLLEGARWHERQPPQLTLLGLVPESLELGIGLSPDVASALPQLVDRIVGEAERLGCGFERADAGRPLSPVLDIADLSLGEAR